MLPIGHYGRIAPRTVAVLALSLGTNLGLPQFLAIPVEGEACVLPLCCAGKKNTLVPDHGGGTPLAGKGGLPYEILGFAPLGWIGTSSGGTVRMGTPPSRPMLVRLSHDKGNQSRESKDDCSCFHDEWH